MTSQVDPSVPVQGNPTTQSMRDNFAVIKDEIEDLQNDIAALPPGGGGATIDDTAASTTTVFSSSKTLNEIGALISDGTTTPTETWSSQKVSDEINAIVVSGGGVAINDTTPSTTTVFSGSRVTALVGEKQDAITATGTANLLTAPAAAGGQPGTVAQNTLAPANITLANAAGSTELPITTSGTTTSKIQTLRNLTRWLLENAGNITLTNSAGSMVLPLTTVGSVQSKLQALRNNMRWLLEVGGVVDKNEELPNGANLNGTPYVYAGMWKWARADQFNDIVNAPTQTDRGVLTVFRARDYIRQSLATRTANVADPPRIFERMAALNPAGTAALSWSAWFETTAQAPGPIVRPPAALPNAPAIANFAVQSYRPYAYITGSGPGTDYAGTWSSFHWSPPPGATIDPDFYEVEWNTVNTFPPAGIPDPVWPRQDWRGNPGNTTGAGRDVTHWGGWGYFQHYPQLPFGATIYWRVRARTVAPNPVLTSPWSAVASFRTHATSLGPWQPPPPYTPSFFAAAREPVTFHAGATSTSMQIVGDFPFISVEKGGLVEINSPVYAHGGLFTPGGLVQSAADPRVTTGVQPYRIGLSQILQLEPISYKYNGNGGMNGNRSYVGLAPERARSIVPEVVGSYRARVHEEDERESDILTTSAEPLVFALINAVKELEGRLRALEGGQPIRRR